MTTTEALNKVKALNERLASFERAGLTSAKTYKNIKESIQTFNLPTTLSKSGEIRISRKKADLQKIVDNPNGLQAKGLSITMLKGTLGNERKKAKTALEKNGNKPTKKEVDQRIKYYGEFTNWLDDHLQEVYNLLDQIDEGDDVIDLLKDGARDYTYEECFKIFNAFTKAQDDYKQKLIKEQTPSAIKTTLIGQPLKDFGSDYK